MTQPQPSASQGPQVMIDTVIDPGTQAGFVRITINSVLVSLAFAIPVETAEQFAAELRRNVIDAVGSIKAEQRKSLIVPSNGLLIPNK